MIEELKASLAESGLELPPTGTMVIPISGSPFAYIAQLQDGEVIGAVLLHEDIADGLIRMLFEWLESPEPADAPELGGEA